MISHIHVISPTCPRVQRYTPTSRYASFQKKNLINFFFLTGMDGINQLQFFYFIFFLAGTIDSLNRTRGKQNLHDWYVCFHVVIVINIEKSCRDLSHTRGKLYACTRRFGLCFMSRTNKAVATRWLATTTTTTKSCDQHLLYYHFNHSLLIFSSCI